MDDASRWDIEGGLDTSGALRKTEGRRAALGLVQPAVSLEEYMRLWRATLEQQIDAVPEISSADKRQARERVVAIADEVMREAQADPFRIQVAFNQLGVYVPETIEDAALTLSDALSRIGLQMTRDDYQAIIRRA